MEKALQVGLPDEILIKIFCYVHPLDVKSLRQACSKFRRLSWDREVAKGLFVRIRDEPIKEHEFDYPHLRIRVSGDGGSDFSRSNFFQIRGKNIHTLHVQDVHSEFLNRVMKYVPSLQCLLSVDCTRPPPSVPDTKRVPSLLCFFSVHCTRPPPTDEYHNPDGNLSMAKNNVRHVGIKCDENELEIDDYLFESIKNLNLANLETFHCVIGSSISGIINPMDPFLLTILENSKSSLVKLCLRTGITDITYLKECLKIIGPQLRTLQLPKTYLSAELINFISAQFPNLVSFDFKFRNEPSLLKDLHSKLPRITRSNFLDPNESFPISDINIAFESILLGFEWKRINGITKLVTRLDVPNDTLKNVLKLLPNLRILTIQLSDEMDNETLKIIGENCGSLRTLDISGSSQITELYPLTLIKGLLSLRLHFFFFNNLVDSFKLHFPELRKLKIDSCYKVTKVAVQNIIRNCLALRLVKLRIECDEKERKFFHTTRSLGLVKIYFIHDDYDHNDDDRPSRLPVW